MGNSDLEAQFDESPCIFPASKEIGVSETSSLLTASSSGESTNHRFLGGGAASAAQPSKPQPAQTVPQPGSMEWLAEQEKSG